MFVESEVSINCQFGSVNNYFKIFFKFFVNFDLSNWIGQNILSILIRQQQ
nr:MAG TPA: hypothetical protein [Caudoviricetes sp.]